MPFADLGDVSLFYTDEGDGEPSLLLIHGWTCDSHDWSWQIGAFADSHRVIAADNRGHGRSGTTEGGYAPRTFAEDLACLVESRGAAPVVAIGHSVGGAIASALAVEHPALVRAVVVVDPAYGVDGDRTLFIADVLRGLRGSSPVEGLDYALDVLEAPTTPRPLRIWHRRRALGTEWHVAIDTLAGTYEAEGQFGQRSESEQYLRERRCPVLAVYANPDRAAWEATIQIHPYSRQVVFNGSGHFLHQERPDQFNALVLDWIAGLPDGASPTA
jgi:pimeloyl-ACP methyl ester carboxylesterase